MFSQKYLLYIVVRSLSNEWQEDQAWTIPWLVPALCCSRKYPYPSHGGVFSLNAPPPPLQKCHFCHTTPWKYHSLWKPKYKLFLVQNTKLWSLLFSQKLWWILWPTHHQIVRTLNMQNVQIIISFCSVFLTQFDLLSDMNVTAVVQNFYIWDVLLHICCNYNRIKSWCKDFCTFVGNLEKGKRAYVCI